MGRAILLFSYFCLGPLSGGVYLSPALASPAEPEGKPETAAPAVPGMEAQQADSPWEHPLWHNATAMMRVYLCDHARRPPSWCDEPQPLPGKAELPEVQGPPLHQDDAQWLAFLEQVDPTNLSQEDVALVRFRATQRRDPQAMEVLGYLYAEGWSVARDYAEAYRWYGLAYLAGEKRVRANMDVVWEQLQRYDVAGALKVAREFDALMAGDVPPGLAAAPEPIPGTPISGSEPAAQ